MHRKRTDSEKEDDRKATIYAGIWLFYMIVFLTAVILIRAAENRAF